MKYREIERKHRNRSLNQGFAVGGTTPTAEVTPPAGERCAGAPGFTLLEIIVVIVVMGVLSAAISVNWSSFMRHQELRGDAINLHKEIVALKARAIEEGDSFKITAGSDAYGIHKWDPASGTGGAWVPVKSIPLSKGVKVENPAATLSDNGLHKLFTGSADKWSGPEIKVTNDNIKAFEDGNILLTSSKAKAGYLIQKDEYVSIRPEIYYCANMNAGSIKWTRQ